jgi:hypothetical protein
MGWRGIGGRQDCEAAIEDTWGAYGTRAIASREVFSLLPRLRREKGLKVGETLSRLEGETEYGIRVDPRRRLARLVGANAVKLGIALQCPWCGQRSWFPLPEVSYTLDCPKCSQTYDFPAASPPPDPWRYRASGPLALPGHARGAYCVLLTLGFFLGPGQLRGKASACWSFTATGKGGQTVEADLGMLWESERFVDRGILVVFGECKTLNDFDAIDFRRMRRIARAFPGAVLVFSTLKSELSAPERRAIASIAEAGRVPWREDHPRNPVLVLTEAELFGTFDPWRTWQQLGGQWAEFGDRPPITHTLIDLCYATQELYLGMSSRGEWSKEYWAKRRQRTKGRQRSPKER